MFVRILWFLSLNNFFINLGFFVFRIKYILVVAGGLLKQLPRYCFRLETYNWLNNFFFRIFRNYTFYFPLIGFRWFRFVLFSGLGYKRRMFKRFKLIFVYIGDRHWILYKFGNNSFVGPHRRRNYVFFSNSKSFLRNDYNFFSSLRKQYVYKMKGFLDARVRGRFLFVRRIRIAGVKTKLSKKQKLL